VDFRLAIDMDDVRLFTQYAEFGDLLLTHLGARFGRRHPPQPGSGVVPLNGTRRTIRDWDKIAEATRPHRRCVLAPHPSKAFAAP